MGTCNVLLFEACLELDRIVWYKESKRHVLK